MSDLIASMYPYELSYKHPAATSRGALTTMPTYFLRLAERDNPAVAGWGECGPMPLLSVDDRPDYGIKVNQLCQQINDGVPPATIDLSDFPSLAFGLEMARLDLARGGRQNLFDGPFSHGVPLPTHGLIWMDTADGVLSQIDAKIAQGYSVIKMKVGALPLEQECQILAAIRQTHSAQSIEIRLDANGAFPPDEALLILDRLAQYEIAFLEQPIRADFQAEGNQSGLTDICARSPIPIGLDETLIGVSPASCRVLLDAIRPQHIVLKPRLLGGFAACEAWIEAAQQSGCTWWINSLLESNIGLSAICQWTAQLEDAPEASRIHGLGTGQLYQNNIPSPLRVDGARLRADPEGKWDFSIVD